MKRHWSDKRTVLHRICSWRHRSRSVRCVVKTLRHIIVWEEIRLGPGIWLPMMRHPNVSIMGWGPRSRSIRPWSVTSASCVVMYQKPVNSSYAKPHMSGTVTLVRPCFRRPIALWRCSSANFLTSSHLTALSFIPLCNDVTACNLL